MPEKLFGFPISSGYAGSIVLLGFFFLIRCNSVTDLNLQEEENQILLLFLKVQISVALTVVWLLRKLAAVQIPTQSANEELILQIF